MLTMLLPTITSLIDKLIPDKMQAAKAKLDLLQLQQTGELKQLDAQMQIALAQINVNNTEAQSESLFKSGWRPFVGWGCGAIVILNASLYFISALLSTVNVHMVLPPPDASMIVANILVSLLGLGMGVLRSQDKALASSQQLPEPFQK
jgi:hypothetical protein